MLDPQHHIILRLKQLPRLGLPAGDEFKSLKDAMDGVVASGEGLVNKNSKLLTGAGMLTNAMQKLAGEYKAAANEVSWLEDRNKDLAESFGMSITEATRLGGVLDANAKNFKIGGDQLRKYTQNLKGLIGGFATVNDLISNNNKYGPQLMQTQKILQANLKLTGAQANKYEQYAAGVGKSSAETLIAQKAIADKIQAATSMTGVFSDIVGEVANLSEDLQIQYGKIPGQLELGILKAKALGFEMADLNAAADNLLDIESSIGQELEYQLLSGRRLTDQSGKSLTNAYRTATLQGDASKQADTLNTILQQEGDTLKDNLFARKQMSELLGMDEASLARALQKKELLNKIGGEALFNLSGEELFTAAKGLGASAEDLEKLAESEDKRTTDEKMADALQIMTSEGIAVMIKNPGDVQAAQSEAAMKGMEGIATTLPGAVSEPTAMLAGLAAEAKILTGAFTNVAGVIEDIVTGNFDIKPQTYTTTSTTKIPEYATGGIIPPGFPNDTFPAMLTSGETVTPVGGASPGVSELAAAIVAAINNQTKALTSAGFGDYYG
jgi:hypothetical protein